MSSAAERSITKWPPELNETTFKLEFYSRSLGMPFSFNPAMTRCSVNVVLLVFLSWETLCAPFGRCKALYKQKTD